MKQIICTIAVLIVLAMIVVPKSSVAQSDRDYTENQRSIRFEKVHEWSITKPLVIPMPVKAQLLFDGTLVIADYALKTINHFDREGDLLATTGGEGRGPGEYQTISAVAIRDDGLLAVADISSAAITVSDVYSEQRYRTRIDPGWSMALQWAGDRLMYSSHPFKIMGGNRGDIIITQFDSDLQSGEQVMRLELQRDNPPEDQISCMFCRFWFRSDLTFYTKPGDQRYLIYHVDPETGHSSKISLENIEPVEYTDAERDQIIERRREAAARVGLEESDEAAPRFKRMIVDMFIDHKERLWVQRHSEDGSSTVFDLFNKNREFLTTVRPPENTRGVMSTQGKRVLFSVGDVYSDPDTWSAVVYEITEE